MVYSFDKFNGSTGPSLERSEGLLTECRDTIDIEACWHFCARRYKDSHYFGGTIPMRFCIALGLLVSTYVCAATKDTIAFFEGGHIAPITLTLYSDSSFMYHEWTDIMFISTKYGGTFSRTDSTITLCTKKNFAWLRRKDQRMNCTVYRMVNNSVLLYTKEEEQRNADYYKAYYTLRRKK